MPIYEYQCLDCSKRFDELIGSFNKEDDVNCPGCHSNHVHRLMSCFGFSSGSSSSVGSSSSSCSTCSSKNCATCHWLVSGKKP